MLLNWLLFALSVVPVAVLGGRLSEQIVGIVSSRGFEVPHLWGRYFSALRHLRRIARDEQNPAERAKHWRLLLAYCACLVWVYAWLIFWVIRMAA
jgi:hypothetical protein